MTRRHIAQLSLTSATLFAVLLPAPQELMDSARRGRPGTPAEVVLRLLVLKHLRNWSYAELEWEVTGNLVYRRFCRIDAGKVPDEKTILRHGQLLDGPVLRELFDRVAELAVEKKVTRGRRMRIDTTVVEAPIRYPTDSGLCEDVVRVMRRYLVRLVSAGVVLASPVRSVSRSVARRLREIGQALRLRGDAAKEAIKKPYRGLLRVTGRVVRQARSAVGAASEQLGALGDGAQAAAGRVLAQLETMLPRAQQVLRQTRARILRGATTTNGKLISIFEPDAQILRRGKLHKPTALLMGRVARWSRCRRPTAASLPTSTSCPTRPTRRCSCRLSSATSRSSAEHRPSSPPIAASTRTRASRRSASSASTTPPSPSQATDRRSASPTSDSDGSAEHGPGAPAGRLASRG